MKKVINNPRELVEWCESILLDDDFLSLVVGLKVSYYYFPYSFEISGVLMIVGIDLSKLPAVLKNADDLSLDAKDDSIKFRATFKAEQI